MQLDLDPRGYATNELPDLMCAVVPTVEQLTRATYGRPPAEWLFGTPAVAPVGVTSCTLPPDHGGSHLALVPLPADEPQRVVWEG